MYTTHIRYLRTHHKQGTRSHVPLSSSIHYVYVYVTDTARPPEVTGALALSTSKRTGWRALLRAVSSFPIFTRVSFSQPCSPPPLTARSPCVFSPVPLPTYIFAMGMGVGEQVRKIELDAYTMFMKATAITGMSWVSNHRDPRA